MFDQTNMCWLSAIGLRKWCLHINKEFLNIWKYKYIFGKGIHMSYSLHTCRKRRAWGLLL